MHELDKLRNNLFEVNAAIRNIVGGIEIGEHIYWSSSEVPNGSNAWTLDFRNYRLENYPVGKSGSGYYTRAISKF
jgi:hypothetical protein